jgi:hypothetical protein
VIAAVEAGSLAERLNRLEARAGIADVIHRYARNIRYGDFTQCSGLFTEDAVFEQRAGDLGQLAQRSSRARSRRSASVRP